MEWEKTHSKRRDVSALYRFNRSPGSNVGTKELKDGNAVNDVPRVIDTPGRSSSNRRANTPYMKDANTCDGLLLETGEAYKALF